MSGATETTKSIIIQTHLRSLHTTLFCILLYCTQVLKTTKTLWSDDAATRSQQQAAQQQTAQQQAVPRRQTQQAKTQQETALPQKKSRPLQNIMRKHSKAPHKQKRQSDLLMTFASKEHKAIAQLIKAWLNEHRSKP